MRARAAGPMPAMPAMTAMLAMLCGALAFTPSSQAENLLLADPDFDDGIGLWRPGATQTSTVATDADACPASFAFRGQSSGSGSPSVVRATGGDCIPSQAGDLLYLEARYRAEKPVHLYLILYAGADCTTPFFGELGPSFPASGPWSSARRAVEVTSTNVAAVRYSVLALDDPGPSQFSAEFDRAYLGRVERIFADGFEGGSSCRWPEAGPIAR
jgi:hypothetical protein